MAPQKSDTKQRDAAKQTGKSQAQDDKTQLQYTTPKPESTSEYEGASDRKNTGNEPVETKTETSSSSGQ